MKKKILVLGIVSMFLLLSCCSLSAVGNNVNPIEQTKSSNGDLPDLTVDIDISEDGKTCTAAWKNIGAVNTQGPFWCEIVFYTFNDQWNRWELAGSQARYVGGFTPNWTSIETFGIESYGWPGTKQVVKIDTKGEITEENEDNNVATSYQGKNKVINLPVVQFLERFIGRFPMLARFFQL